MSFGKTLFSVAFAILLAAGALLAAEPATAPSSAGNSVAVSTPRTQAAGPAVVISLKGPVNDYSRDALFRGFERARTLGAKTVIIDINTYGGLVTSGLDISRFLKRQNDLHTIAFVSDKAISAGAMIAVACDEIVMAPSSVLGDCAPIVFKSDSTLEELPPAERAKQESPVVQDFRDSAERNGYDPLLLTSMVSVQRTVYYLEDGEGHRRFVEEPQYKELSSQGWKPVAGLNSPVDGPSTLLTVYAGEAVKLGLARGEATSAESLAAQRHCTIVADLRQTFADQLVAVLGNTWVRGILLLIFVQSLFIALHAPGHGAAEATALVSLGLLVGIPLLTGYASWWEIVLIFAGLALVAFEIFVFPGHLISALLGSIMVIAGLLLTFVGDAFAMPGSWSMPGTWASLEKGVYAVAGALVCSLLLSMWLRQYLPKLPYFNRLILTATTGGGRTPPTAPASGALPASMPELLRNSKDIWPFTGTIGVATSELKPGGSAEFPYADHTKVASVVCDCGFVPAGAKLVVREVRGNRVVVQPVA